MKIFEPLIKELQDTLKEFEIIEEIDFKISNIDNFDSKFHLLNSAPLLQDFYIFQLTFLNSEDFLVCYF